MILSNELPLRLKPILILSLFVFSVALLHVVINLFFLPKIDRGIEFMSYERLQVLANLVT